ncbi:Com family DNA-binding transcriptional regulator [Citrobacter braakii]
MPLCRCEKCNKLLLKGHFIEIEIKCPRCGHLQTLKAVELHIKGKQNES